MSLTPHGRIPALASLAVGSALLASGVAASHPAIRLSCAAGSLGAGLAAHVSDRKRREWSRVASTITAARSETLAAQLAYGSPKTESPQFTPIALPSSQPGLAGEIERFYAARGIPVGTSEMPPAPAFRRVGLVLGHDKSGKPIDPNQIMTDALLTGLQLALGLDRQPSVTISSLGLVMEIPRPDREVFRYAEMAFTRPDGVSPHWLFGVGMDGTPITAPLTEVVGSITAGASGSGKTSIDTSAMAYLCETYSPDEVEIWLADFQGGASFELDIDQIPHVTRPMVQDPVDLVAAIAEFAAESDRRLALFNANGVKSWVEYRAKFPAERMPYLILWIEEAFSYLQSEVGKALANELSALASRVRKTGLMLHLVIQSPSKVVLPDGFSALRDNLPTRHVGRMESALGRAVIGESTMPTMSLLGKGDSLLQCPAISGVVRVQGLLVSPDDRDPITARIVTKWGERSNPVTESFNRALTVKPEPLATDLLPTELATQPTITSAERARVLSAWRLIQPDRKPSLEKLVKSVWDVSKGGGTSGKNAAYPAACDKAVRILKDANPKGWNPPKHWNR
ncbi:hypothetical protein H6F46_11895 [Limnothrix sp. FACHB-1083]|uniref:FtsK/SpoIIIE domain-containing protein n=1 Tax=unclassified Limnothrix TaxID=2632864 RepID=UPI001680E2E4|nr:MULTISPECIES: FtsK/SpoIIIE domain-containing protein [unclassified Limnothrix]MBD2161392.1 hypothetical protein [Limnothrix sp. FACHB-1083]MBD2192096.1 hypothetical protein [Limnothrix sp. FACHB-1088]